MILRCTAKVVKLLGARALYEVPAAEGDWYVNLVYLERRKCLLITHAGSLFTVFAADVRKADLIPFGNFVSLAIQRELKSEALAADTFGNMDQADWRLAKTASRSVLGCMNEMATHCWYAVKMSGGFPACDFGRLNHELRRTMHAPRGYARPIDVVRQQSRGAKDVGERGRLLQLHGSTSKRRDEPFRKVP
ncbi:MAG: hypothetical protein ABR573_00035 [Candidatus Dormibacteria bacterium]